MKNIFQVVYNSEIFVHKLELRNTRVLWITIGTFMTYEYFSSYLKFNEIKRTTFQKNFKSIHDKYQKDHFSSSKSTIDLHGFPDQGDWLFSKEIVEADLKELLRFKDTYDERWKEYCFVMPLFIVAGLWTPVITSVLGVALVYSNRKIDKKINEIKFRAYKDYIIGGLIINSFLSCFGLRFF